MNKCKVFLTLAIVALIAAGCIVHEQARTHETGGGSGVKPIDVSLDAMTVFEGGVAGAFGSGIEATDQAAAKTRHFAVGLLASDGQPDISRIERARLQDARRPATGGQAVARLERDRTPASPILESTTLEKHGLYLVWHTPLHERISKCWTGKNTVLLETSDYKLFALDLYNGYARWVYRFLNPLDAPPRIADGIVWTSAGSMIHAIDAVQGQPRWRTPLKFPASTPIFNIHHKHYIGSFDNRVYGLNKDDVYPDWNFGTFAAVTAMPLVERSVVYVGSEDGTMYAYDFTMRENLWQVRTRSPITAGFVHDEDYIYFASESYDIYKVSKASGSFDRAAGGWRQHARGPVKLPVVMLDADTLLVKGEGAPLLAINTQDGNIKWENKTAVRPVAVGKHLYVISENQTLMALDKQTGETIWEESIAPFRHVATNTITDAILLSTRDGHIVLLQEKGGMDLKPASSVSMRAGQ